jgi:hypothetical protein
MPCPCQPHHLEKLLATIADLAMFAGAALLAKEAFARERDIKEVEEARKGISDPAFVRRVFVRQGVVIKADDPDLIPKLEQSNARRNRTALWWGIGLTAGGFLLHIVSLWAV